MLLLKGGLKKKSGLFTTPVNRDGLSVAHKRAIVPGLARKQAFVTEQKKRKSDQQIISADLDPPPPPPKQ